MTTAREIAETPEMVTNGITQEAFDAVVRERDAAREALRRLQEDDDVGSICPFDQKGDPGVGVNEPCPVCEMLGTLEALDVCLGPKRRL